MLVHPVMAHHVVAEIHRHEAGELKEARIDLPPRARIIERHRRDHVLLEPGERALCRDGVDRGRCLARVDRAAHHGERRRATGMFVRVHQAGRCIDRHRGLAYRQHVRARADMRQIVGDVVDIVVEIEAAGVERHVLGVAPVGDVDVVARQHPLHRAAQQRGVMARHGCHDQQLLLAFDALAPEPLELAERLAQHDLLEDGDGLAVDDRALEAEFGLPARLRGVGEDVETRGDHRPEAGAAERIGGILQPALAHVRKQARARQPVPLEFIGIVEQIDLPRRLASARTIEKSDDLLTQYRVFALAK